MKSTKGTRGAIRLMCTKGDEALATWDHAGVMNGTVNLTADAAIKEAERIFAQQRAKGFVAFSIDGQRVDEFDPRVKDIVLTPRIIGG